jgi:TolB protein
LYLVSPVGVRYPMHTWTDFLAAPELLSWSGDKTRVLLWFDGSQNDQYEQLTLSTGKFTVVTLAGQAQPTGYTPDGQNILGVADDATPPTIARYSLTGKLLTVLTHRDDETAAVYAPNGTALAVSGANGLELVSNGGRLIRSLPVPGTDPTSGCSPVRWWSPTMVLAQCGRLWLVPTSGKRPVAEIPEPDGPGVYFGDGDAWQLPSGLYVQAIGRCSVPLIFQQAANGPLTPVAPPNIAGATNEILAALGPQLLIETSDCGSDTSLLWFNPATQAEQWLLRAPDGSDGVIDALAYGSSESG